MIFWKNAERSAKLRGPWYQKKYFQKLQMGVYLRAKFEVSSIILTNSIPGTVVILPHLPMKERI